MAVLEARERRVRARGLHGASTDAIARSAGISQPYLFRLFGTKKELFIAVIERCFARTLESFRAARCAASPARTRSRRSAQAYADSIEDDHDRCCRDSCSPTRPRSTTPTSAQRPRAATADLVDYVETRLRGRPRHDRAVLRQGDAHERARGDAVLDHERRQRALGRAPGRGMQGGRRMRRSLFFSNS